MMDKRLCASAGGKNLTLWMLLAEKDDGLTVCDSITEWERKEGGDGLGGI